MKLERRYPAGVENASDHAELAVRVGREQFDHHKRLELGDPEYLPAYFAAAESLPPGGGR